MIALCDVAATDSALVERFYRGIYLDAFASRREPLETWQRALAGDAAYALTITLALDGDDLVGGVTYELYPHSRCGFITYLVVAPRARRRGLGRRLFEHAAQTLYARGAHAAFGEATSAQLVQFERWGGRRVPVRYVQPSLGPGLARDRSLNLFVHPPVPVVSGEMVRAFLTELFAVTEQSPPDAEVCRILDELDPHAALDLLSVGALT